MRLSQRKARRVLIIEGCGTRALEEEAAEAIPVQAAPGGSSEASSGTGAGCDSNYSGACSTCVRSGPSIVPTSRPPFSRLERIYTCSMVIVTEWPARAEGSEARHQTRNGMQSGPEGEYFDSANFVRVGRNPTLLRRITRLRFARQGGTHAQEHEERWKELVGR